LKPGATAARRKNRGAKKTVFAQMPVKLLEAGRAESLQAKPIKQTSFCPENRNVHPKAIYKMPVGPTRAIGKP
jgi:hypothetical protein